MTSTWLESRPMLFIFSWSAWIVICLGVLTLFAIIWGGQWKSSPVNDIVGWTAFSAFCLVGIAILIFILGMAIHCLLNRELSVGAKILWSIFAFLTAPFGAAIYFFAVYTKQRKSHREVRNA
jgi:hypothetical protein